jgi:hypothetical protein
MDASNRLALFVLLLTLSPFAVWNITAEGDGRLIYDEVDKLDGELHLAAISVKKTLSDSKGDRLILFFNGEAEDNFKEVMLHEAYIRYKGPLSLWNITVGRFAIPFGTILSYTSSRYLWSGLESWTLGLEADDGLQVSGVTERFDYAFAVTRGVGKHGDFEKLGKGLLTSRVAIPLDDEELFVIGISGAAGRLHSHNGVEERMVGGLDGSFTFSRLTGRTEFALGRAGEHTLAMASGIIDFPVYRSLEINSGARYVMSGDVNMAAIYGGMTFRVKGFVIRGGYTYVNEEEPNHNIAVQLYYQYSWSR